MDKNTRNLLLLAGLGVGAYFFYKNVFPQLLTALKAPANPPIAPVSNVSPATALTAASSSGLTTAPSPLILASSADDTSPAITTTPALRLNPILNGLR